MHHNEVPNQRKKSHENLKQKNMTSTHDSVVAHSEAYRANLSAVRSKIADDI